MLTLPLCVLAVACGGDDSSSSVKERAVQETFATLEGTSANLVIAQCQMNFLKPVLGEFTATCEGQDEQKLLDHLRRKGRARLTLTIQLHCEGILVGEMVGEFAAVLKR